MIQLASYDPNFVAASIVSVLPPQEECKLLERGQFGRH